MKYNSGSKNLIVSIVFRNGKIEGYYSGYTFANQLGLTTQVPFNIEIVSNSASAKDCKIYPGQFHYNGKTGSVYFPLSR